MPVNLKGQSPADFAQFESRYNYMAGGFCHRSESQEKNRYPRQGLAGKNIVLIFEKNRPAHAAPLRPLFSMRGVIALF